MITITSKAAKQRCMISDFIGVQCQDEPIDAIKASMRMETLWGLSIDWHEFAAVLATYAIHGKAEILPNRGPDNFTVYRVKGILA